MQHSELVVPKGDEFHILSSYVAFRGSSQGSMRTTSATVDSVTKQTGDSGLVASEVVEGSAVLLKSKTSASATDHAAEEADPDTTNSPASSSIFSTLSQHIGKIQPQKENVNTTGSIKEPVVTTISERPHDGGDKNVLVSKTPTPTPTPIPTATANTITTTTRDDTTNAIIGTTNISSSPAVVSVSCLPPFPSAPEGQPSPQFAFSLPEVASPTSPTQGIVTSSRLPGIGNIMASVPPPLPSRDPQQDPKIVELRETSEAVERLVRAFALLRGHAAPPSATADTDSDLLAREKAFFTTKDTEKLSSFRQQHGVGDAGTVRVSQSATHTTSRRMPPYTGFDNIIVSSSNSSSKVASKNKKDTSNDDNENDENRKKSIKMNEAAIEDAIMCLVMELLQRDAKQPFEERKDRKAIQPSFEVVDMDNFRGSTHSNTGKRRKPAHDKLLPFSVFEGGMQTFAPDNTDAAESLYNSIIDALQKYVWSHVSAPRNQRNYEKGGGGHFTPASAFFVWVLLLDLLSVCMQVLENRLGAGRNDTNPVWIQYEGPHEAESLARNAVHCLPFEVLDPSTGETGKTTTSSSSSITTVRRSLFRMEYWVTSSTMWTVTEALTASIREGIVSRSDGYRAFRSGDSASLTSCGFSADDMGMLDPSAPCPTRIPLFSLVPTERTCGVSLRDDTPHVRKTFMKNDIEEDGNNNTEDYFQIEPQTLELLAHTVSTASTELLERDIQTTSKNYRQNYQDASRAVTEAVSELLNDAGIRAAVHRRAKTKMREISERREVSGRATREEKERSMIEAAEAEAERVVERIIQEMRLEEANKR
ncbi:hypothetical protein LSM04_004508 [Trypanosoma melophagium]|nr:hypothetical protein LSM04_004508 [Trypanosoma melophagium]